MTDAAAVADAFRRLAVGVAVITTLDAQTAHGSTGMAWAEAAEPPLVLTTLSRDGRTRELVESSGVFGVNVLALEQQELTWQFARDPEDERFAGVSLTRGPVRAVPLIEGAVATFECELQAIHPFGAHDIMVGRTLWFHFEPSDLRPPVVHYDGSLWSLDRPAGAS